ncbi:MAG: 30S ribosomal protein S21 [Rickettsiales bacterium]|nr:30S ribosomal protein S21 [Rickettsiales bacterium]
MATVVIYNDDIQGALRALKKEQQKEGTFRYIKAKKTFKTRHEKYIERMSEIIRRKIKDWNEKLFSNFYNKTTAKTAQPFVFRISGYLVKIFNSGKVLVFLHNKKINELSFEDVDFDNPDVLSGKIATATTSNKTNQTETKKPQDEQL